MAIAQGALQRACPACRGPLWPLQRRLQQPLVPVPIPRSGEQRGAAGAAAAGPAAAQRAEMVASRFVPVVHGRRSGGHSRRSATASKSERPCLIFGTSFLCHAVGRSAGGRQGTARSARVARLSSVWFSEKDVRPRHAVAPRNRQGTGEVASRDRAGDPCAGCAALPRRGHRRTKSYRHSLARDQLVPVVHHTTYEALREVSPLLGSRSGLKYCRKSDGRTSRPSSPSWSPSSSIAGVARPGRPHKRSRAPAWRQAGLWISPRI